MKKRTNSYSGLALILILLSAASAVYAANAPLLAGQHIPAGNVSVWDDGDNLHIRYNTANSWYLTETHAHVATTLAGIPQKNGNPIPGRFAYKQGHDQSASYEYVVALDADAGATLYIATHAVVCKDGEGAPASTQSILASQTLWAGKHISSGNVIVSVIDGNLVITYETADGWQLTETHLYIGATPPTKSAPGRFPYKHGRLGGATTDTYVIPLSRLSAEPGDIFYLAAHAVVQKPGQAGEDYQEETGWAEGQRIRKKGNWAMFFSVTIPEPPEPSEGEQTCETAWGAGFPFPGRNWATYFTYTVGSAGASSFSAPPEPHGKTLLTTWGGLKL